MGIFNIFNKKQDLDEVVISQLAKVGSNLEKPHNIDFFLYFPSTELDEKAKIFIQDQYPDYEIIIKESTQKGITLCEIHGKLVPTIDALQDLRKNFTNIANKLHGQYDGWGAEIED
ncbi:MAG: ribonuclease E inhibitor RraB [Candidatus Pacebacteria bacterium]|nr:ribonuclease E inhibitor RraB [Candidatus Paceibacterota bacterium]